MQTGVGLHRAFPLAQIQIKSDGNYDMATPAPHLQEAPERRKACAWPHHDHGLAGVSGQLEVGVAQEHGHCSSRGERVQQDTLIRGGWDYVPHWLQQLSWAQSICNGCVHLCTPLHCAGGMSLQRNHPPARSPLAPTAAPKLRCSQDEATPSCTRPVGRVSRTTAHVMCTLLGCNCRQGQGMGERGGILSVVGEAREAGSKADSNNVA